MEGGVDLNRRFEIRLGEELPLRYKRQCIKKFVAAQWTLIS